MDTLFGANAPSPSVVSIHALIAYENNPRRHNKRKMRRLVTSLRRHGQLVPVLVTEELKIIDGHAVVAAMRELGYDEVTVVVVSGKTADEIRALRLTINRLPETAKWDAVRLTSELNSLVSVNFDIEMTGFRITQKERSRAARLCCTEIGATSENVSRIGDDWKLDSHQVIVGDFADFDTRDLIARRSVAAAVLIHAPSDVSEGDLPSFATILGELPAVLAAGSPILVILDCRALCELLVASKSVEFEPVEIRPWVDQHGARTNSVGMILTVLRARQVAESQRPRSGRRASVTMDRLLRDYTKRDEAILVPGGCELVHCEAERLSRRYCALISEPKRADTAIRRWQDRNGRAAILATTGHEFSAVTRLRKGDLP